MRGVEGAERVETGQGLLCLDEIAGIGLLVLLCAFLLRFGVGNLFLCMIGSVVLFLMLLTFNKFGLLS